MSWAKKLKEVATEKAVKPPPQPKPRPRLRREPPSVVTVQVRPCNGTDPGEVALIHYQVDGDTLNLTDEMGAPLNGDETSVKLDHGADPATVAKGIARGKLQEAGQFGRRIDYGANDYV